MNSFFYYECMRTEMKAEEIWEGVGCGQSCELNILSYAQSLPLNFTTSTLPCVHY